MICELVLGLLIYLGICVAGWSRTSRVGTDFIHLLVLLYLLTIIVTLAIVGHCRLLRLVHSL